MTGGGGSKKPLARRDVLKAAVAIGGVSALAACLDQEGDSTATPTAEEQQFPAGPEDVSSIPERQHAWGNYLVRDKFGNTALPQHQVLLFLDYEGSVPPSQLERDQCENAFQTLDRAFRRGTGGHQGARINEGLLFMVGYAPSYFERFDDPLHPSVDLSSPSEVLTELGEDPSKADSFDAVVLLTSDVASIVLAAEHSLLGNVDAINGVAVKDSLDGLFTVRERRTGFVGRGLPAANLDEERIPDASPLSMGFKSGFRDNLPGETKVSIPEGPFAEGTTMLTSRLRLDLEQWYDQDDTERVHEMFSTEHTTEQVGESGTNLATDSEITEEMVGDIEEYAADHGRVGHTHKLAQARDDDFEARILRRSEGVDVIPDAPGQAGMNFSSVQETMTDFVETRKAMNSPELDDHVDESNHGILGFMDVERRATFLLPPRSRRALPVPKPG